MQLHSAVALGSQALGQEAHRLQGRGQVYMFVMGRGGEGRGACVVPWYYRTNPKP